MLLISVADSSDTRYNIFDIISLQQVARQEEEQFQFIYICQQRDSAKTVAMDDGAFTRGVHEARQCDSPGADE